jgi:hypothetical protein
MKPIAPARLQPGLTADSIASRLPAEAAGAGTERIITGRALIIWDAARPGKKRDAIDTDQITPATDCVSESTEWDTRE